ncbi:hypothetical protein GGS23DRAFT_599116 [Durotheca rogersii]|uniref:uncharacterized protein n=1 Tax=Durotheca rogersii TaxID=419775 RepID=UPI00221E5DB2|nr:uncharacterized protein GGS23DRAFT_599116 [Durotheca rogersii]KAI5860903.1 hypothetical protein GGS23DRAFT_599116 [Durotheca rogersii]
MTTNSSTAEDAAVSLTALVRTTTDVISQIEASVHSTAVGNTSDVTAPPPLSSSAGSIDPLSLAHDSAILIKAHTTKLSLLIINEPFTPSAIAKVLRELVASPVPAIASAVQLCHVEKYTAVLRQDLAWRCLRVLKELKSLVELIPLDGRVLPDTQKNGGQGGKGSLAATGVIWAACDDVVLLKNMGTVGLLVKKAEEYRDTLKDILEELKEYREEVDEENDGDSDGDQTQAAGIPSVAVHMQSTHLSAQEMLDDLMAPRRIPRGDPDKIRERLDSCLKRLRLTTLLYAAIVKRRLKALPSLPTASQSTITQRLDEVFPLLKRLPHRFGEVACAFYELDRDSIDRAMDCCFFDAFAASEMLMKPWEGQRDEFTEWAEKFQVGIKKPD